LEPRYGRLYAKAVLRPLAEQVVDALDAHPGDTACDLMCDAGTLGVALGSAVGDMGRVVLVDTDAALLAAAMAEASACRCHVTTHLAAGAASALGDASLDRVASLCTFGFWSDGSLLDTADRALRPTGRAAVLTWDPALQPPHEAALVEALRDVVGIQSRFLTRCLASPDAGQSPRWEPVAVHDVVRFDGITEYWTAMVVERPIARELEHQPERVIAAVRDACQRALLPWTGADGTMRIPVLASLWCSRRGGAG
jgi:SAM-dependent methyltransferase